MHIGRNNRNIRYSMQDLSGKAYTLQETKEEKDLGIWIDPNLKFSVHVAHAAKKAHQILGLIRS